MSRFAWNRAVAIGVVIAGLSAVSAWATEPSVAELSTADPQAAEITALIDQVTADDSHRAATDKLLEIGIPAVEQLSKAADVDEQPVVNRCFEVLTRMMNSADAKTSDAAQEAIERLTESEIEIVGRRARNALRVRELQLRRRAAALNAAPPPVAVPNAGLAVPARGAGVQINGQFFGGGRSVKISFDGKKKQVEVQDGDEKVAVTEVEGKDIEIKHTRIVDGKSKTDEYKADNLDDLKKKHPEAAKLYEKHAGGKNLNFGGGAVQIQIGAAPAGGAPVPALVQTYGRETSTSSVGPRTIKAEQEGRKIEICDDDGANIRVKVTTVVDGKDVVREYSGNTFAALKTEHPDAAKLYEQYTGRAQ